MTISKVSMVREGGFAGVARSTEVDVAALPPDEAGRLTRLVEAARFFELPAVVPTPRQGADRFVYRVTVEGDGRRHSVRVADGAVPEALQPLIDYLMAARPAAPPGG
jgi:hypothetical protein